MRRLAQAIPLSLLFLFVAVPAHAANLPILSPGIAIVPEACQSLCPCGAGGLLQLIQNVMNAAVSIGVIALLFVLVYTGALFISAPTNPEAKSKARGMAANAMIGFLIVLSAWLMVDFLMKLIYNPDATFSGEKVGPWNDILQFEGGTCIETKGITAIPGLPGVGSAIINDGVLGGGATGGSATLNRSGTGACNAAQVRAAAVLGGISMSEQQANILACVAGPESSCGATNKNYNWNGAVKKPPSTAWGPFQITLKGNSQCFENQACYKAAGVTGPLNCSSAFNSGGYAIPGTTLSNCQKAAATLSCSAVAANCVAAKQGYGAWTADPNSSKQKACINGGG